MKKATLSDLFSKKITDNMKGVHVNDFLIEETPICFLPLYVLNSIAIQIIYAEWGEEVMQDSTEKVLLSHAMLIITKRAMGKGLSIF